MSATSSLSEEIAKNLSNDEFAITDLSHSKAIIELSGKNVKEVLKKGCPINFNDINKNEVVNSIFNGIAVTIRFYKRSTQQDKSYVFKKFWRIVVSFRHRCLT